MKKILFVTAFVFALAGVSIASNAYAQTSSDISASSSASVSSENTNIGVKADARTGTKTEPVRPAPLYKDLEKARENMEREAKRLGSSTKAAVTNMASTTRAEIKAEVKARIAINLKNKIAKTSDQAIAMVTRLSSIADKIEARISKLKDSGVETSAATSAMLSARTKIIAAETSANAIANVSVSEEDPRASLEALKTAVEMARTALKSAHAALVDIVNSLKPGVNANSTTTINSNI